MITNRQNVQNNTNTSPHPIPKYTIDRFSPIYWRIDGPKPRLLPLQIWKWI